MKILKTIILPIFFITSMVYAYPASDKFIDDTQIERVTEVLTRKSTVSPHVIRRGVKQAASFWMETDGSREEFTRFCEAHICKTLQEKEILFERLCDNFESIFGHNNRVSIDLLLPTHVEGIPSLPIDQFFGAYDGLSHFNDDMFSSKIAFIIILNFPHFTLEEKNDNGADWTNLEWGYVRLGDLFTSRVPAYEQQKINNAVTRADHYISNYNIIMDNVWSDKNEKFWGPQHKFISHWGLRDELKAAYADRENGAKKQQIIYNVMLRIIDQSIPEEVINKNEYIWYPSTNQVFYNIVEIEGPSEKNNRYKHLLEIFKSIQSSDSYYGENSNFISRKFDDEYEISVKETERLFHDLLSSPQVMEVAKLISQRLGRKLEPFDIWYDGFKSRSSMDQANLDQRVRTKYPDKESFEKDLPRMLTDLGFSPQKAAFICDHITVDASVGAGHAWESAMRSDNARLRTRIGSDGMDYKGYNIGIHEFGHNVEQVISLHDVPNYFLRGVPNTAFTEALAFTFQSRDLELLGMTQGNPSEEYLKNLDIFWNCYEIMGVAMVDIKVWQWLYENPRATDEELKQAVLRISKEIWNRYYAPVFKKKDQTILAIYSHMIDAPLYLSAYPIGHLIDFQFESFLKGKNIGSEVERMFKIGRKTPAVWMKEAMGNKLSVEPLLTSISTSVKKVAEQDKQVKKK